LREIRTAGSARGDGFKRATLKARLYPPQGLETFLAFDALADVALHTDKLGQDAVIIEHRAHQQVVPE
jgi:hypothetical protein